MFLNGSSLETLRPCKVGAFRFLGLAHWRAAYFANALTFGHTLPGSNPGQSAEGIKMKIECWKGRSLEGIPAMKLMVNGFRVAGHELTEKSGLQRIALFEVSKEDFANAVRRALLVVTAFLFFGCGGAEFSAIQSQEGDSGNVQPTSGDAGDVTQDAATAPHIGVDSGEARDAGSTPIGEPDASGFDLGDGGVSPSPDSGVDTGAPACLTQSTSLVQCGATETTYPAGICLYLVSASGGGDYATSVTPPACNTWCTFTCACLGEPGNSPCRIGASMITCVPDTMGRIVAECKAD